MFPLSPQRCFQVLDIGSVAPSLLVDAGIVLSQNVLFLFVVQLVAQKLVMPADVPHGVPRTHPEAMAVADVCGYIRISE